MSIVIVDKPAVGKSYIYPFVPNNANWSRIDLNDVSWDLGKASSENEIYVDCDDNASVAELGDLINMIRSITRFFGRYLKALPIGTSFGSIPKGVHWLTTSNSTDVKEIRIKHDSKGKVSDAYTYFKDKKSAVTLANAIKFAFEHYGISAHISIED